MDRPAAPDCGACCVWGGGDDGSSTAWSGASLSFSLALLTSFCMEGTESLMSPCFSLQIPVGGQDCAKLRGMVGETALDPPGLSRRTVHPHRFCTRRICACLPTSHPLSLVCPGTWADIGPWAFLSMAHLRRPRAALLESTFILRTGGSESSFSSLLSCRSSSARLYNLLLCFLF